MSGIFKSPGADMKKLTVTLNKTAYTFCHNEKTIRINRKNIHRYVFFFDSVELIATCDEPLKVSFYHIVLIRLLSRGSAVIRCRNGRELQIGFLGLAGILLLNIVHPAYVAAHVKRQYRHLSDLMHRGRFIRDVELEVDELIARAADGRILSPPDLAKQAVYLRTILAYGVSAGGSVGHIAGVLNNLGHFSGKPIFITSDLIPTVDHDIETHIVSPSEPFIGIKEVRDMYYAKTFADEALAVLRDKTPAFIYQRESLFSYSGVKISRALQVPLVVEFNGSEIWVSNNWGTPLNYESVARKVEQCSLQSADVIVVVSDPLKKDLTANGINPDRILVNPNGVDPLTYSPDVDGTPIRESHRLGDKVVIGFIGTFGHWHGAENLAEAFGRLVQEHPGYRGSIHLMMIGDGLKMPQVKKSLADHDVLDSCTLTGLVPQEQGPAHLAACDILVAPHRPNQDGTPFFGSPTKLFEYMAMGKGIVASDLDQIGQILDHDHTAWLVPPGDIESLKDGVRVLIDDENLRDRLGATARETVIAHYSWKKHTQRIVEKIKAVLG
ncbi:glycosyltransferase family 4 protein [Candidatus Latescibacterota bacterium]